MTVHRLARRITTQAAGRANRARVGSFKSAARRLAVLTAYADRHNQGTTTAGQYLKAIGVDDEFAAAYDSPLGKWIKKAYVAIHGTEPSRIRLAAVGRRLHRKVGYLTGEPALAVATRTYPRTAALLNGAS